MVPRPARAVLATADMPPRPSDRATAAPTKRQSRSPSTGRNCVNRSLKRSLVIVCMDQIIAHQHSLLHRLISHDCLAAGCIAQTVWNFLSGNPLSLHIKDLDLTYYDRDDLSYQAESKRIREALELFKEVPITVDVKNQARVHLWHEERFGYPIKPYTSVEDAINSWHATATCVGVRYCRDKFVVYAPYGLNDAFGMMVKPNKGKVTEDIYTEKAMRWKECWPMLHVAPW